MADLLELVDKLEELIAEGKRIPFSSSVVINEQTIYEIIDEIRASFPDEIKKARWIIKERQEMMEEAEKEAAKIKEEAAKKAQHMVGESEIVKMAEAEANRVLEEAKAQSRQIRLSAEDYADETLANLEVNLGKLLTAVQRGRDRLNRTSETQSQV